MRGLERAETQFATSGEQKRPMLAWDNGPRALTGLSAINLKNGSNRHACFARTAAASISGLQRGALSEFAAGKRTVPIVAASALRECAVGKRTIAPTVFFALLFV